MASATRHGREAGDHSVIVGGVTSAPGPLARHPRPGPKKVLSDLSRRPVIGLAELRLVGQFRLGPLLAIKASVIPLQRATDLAAALFKARGEDLLGFLRRRLRSDADARDIAQETYLRFIRLADPRRIDNAEAYLFRIASNLLWEHRMRQRTTITDADGILSAQLVADQTPLDLAVSAEVAGKLRAVVEALPPAQRAIVILQMRDGLTYGEIAGRIGVSESMVKKRAYMAFAFCRKRLRELQLEIKEAP